MNNLYALRILLESYYPKEKVEELLEIAQTEQKPMNVMNSLEKEKSSKSIHDLYNVIKLKDQLIDILNNANVLFLYTGAGMGVDSGLQTFRDTDGFWEKHPNIGELKLGFKDIANPKNYLKHPEIGMNFYRERLQNYQKTEPHSGFYDLLNYGKSLKHGLFSITSNVDNHFNKAGFPKNRIYEIHGNLNYWQCSDYNCSRKNFLGGLIEKNISPDINVFDLDLWTCPNCGRYLRPNICMFEDFDWFSSKYNMQNSLLDEFNYKTEFEPTCVIEIGAGDAIATIRRSAELTAYKRKTKLIRINTVITESDKNDPDVICLNLSAKEGIEFLMNLLEKNKGDKNE